MMVRLKGEKNRVGEASKNELVMKIEIELLNVLDFL